MLEININEKIIIRKANKNDDLERISELIYNVDPYIYPYWFENLENCKKVLPKLILEDNFIFNIETIYIAINSDNNEIVGLSSIVDKYTNLEYDYEKISKKNDNIKYTIKNYIKPMIENIKTKNIATITNMCVKKEYRNMHIGYKLLKTVIDDYKYNNFNNVEYIEIDVLAHNPSAIKLYQNLGFKQVSDIEKGFNGNNMEKPEVILMTLKIK